MRLKSDWQEQRIAEKRAVIDLPVNYHWLRRYAIDSPEYWEAFESELESEAKDLVEFIRDHRSRDHHHITIETVRTTVCKFCGTDWGIVEDAFSITPNCCESAMRTFGNWDIEE